MGTTGDRDAVRQAQRRRRLERLRQRVRSGRYVLEANAAAQRLEERARRGIRIEDVVWIDADGAVHNLTDYPKDLVIGVKG